MKSSIIKTAIAALAMSAVSVAAAHAASHSIGACLITKTDTNPFFVKMKEGATAEPIADNVNKIAAIASIFFRPYLSAKGPEIIIAKVAVSVREATENPSCNLVS